jgi:hypothetical protein
MPKTTTTIHVQEGQYAPLATKDYVLIGPGTLEVTRWSNGAVDVQITQGTSSPTRDAIRNKLERVGY